MRPPVYLRTLAPWGWAVLAAGVLLVVLTVLQGVGFRWDPFGLADRRVRAAEVTASAAVRDAAARRSEVEGSASQTRRIEDFHQRSVVVAVSTAQATTLARRAHDAETLLEPERAARLVRHDRELCRLAPAVCDAAAADPAAVSDEPMCAAEASGNAQQG